MQADTIMLSSMCFCSDGSCAWSSHASMHVGITYCFLASSIVHVCSSDFIIRDAGYVLA